MFLKLIYEKSDLKTPDIPIEKVELSDLKPDVDDKNFPALMIKIHAADKIEYRDDYRIKILKNIMDGSTVGIIFNDDYLI